MLERVLHVCLRTPEEKQPALAAALRSLAASDADYGEVDWIRAGSYAPTELLQRAEALRPSIVFMQIQRAGVFSAQDISALRSRCAPDAVIVNWDGDQHHEPNSDARRWFVELGRVCDASLVVNTKHPAEYAQMGVQNPGYLQIGIDGDLYKPSPPTPGTPPIVLLAGRYQTHYARNDLVAKLSARYGASFGVYGSGWTGPSARPFLRQHEEAGVYAAAEVAISMSIRADLPCYTSDRLFRAMGSGGLVFVQSFLGMRELGLLHPCSLLPDPESGTYREAGLAANCFTWHQPEGLFDAIDYAMQHRGCDAFFAMRRAAAQLVHERHTWKARMPEFLGIVEAVRQKRGAA